MSGEPPRVFALLSPMIDDCVEQLAAMSFDEVKQIVESIPAGLRMMVEPVAEPLTSEYLRRVAEYTIAVELEKGYSPVSDVVHSHPENSEVLDALPELSDLIDDDGLIHLRVCKEITDTLCWGPQVHWLGASDAHTRCGM